jgi:hypothetical protein
MALLDINWNPSSRQLRQFAGLQFAFFAAISAWLYHRTGYPSPALALVAVSLVAGLAGLVRPGSLRWLFVGWILAVFPVGWLVSHVLLALLFYLVITPVGAMMKCCGYDPMQRRLDRQATSYWQPRSEHRAPQRYFKQY